MASLLNFAKRAYNQANPLDNGRTFKNPQGRINPGPAPSAFQQATHSGLTNVAGNMLVKPLTQAGHTLYSGVAAPVRLAAGEISHNDLAIRNARMSAPTPLQFAGAAAVPASFALGGPLLKGGEKLAAPVVGKIARPALQKLANRVISNTVAAPAGGIYSAGSGLSQGGSPKDIPKNLAQGTLITAGIGAGTPIAFAGAKGGGKLAIKAAKNRVPLNQEGGFSLSSAAERHPAVQQLDQTADLLKFKRDQMRNNGMSETNPELKATTRAYQMTLNRRDQTLASIEQGGYAKVPGGTPRPHEQVMADIRANAAALKQATGKTPADFMSTRTKNTSFTPRSDTPAKALPYLQKHTELQQEYLSSGKSTQANPKLDAYNQAIQQHGGVAKALPKGIKPTDIKDIHVFGSSTVKGSTPHDIDVALTLPANHPALEGSPVQPGRAYVGNIHYSYFADNPTGQLAKDQFINTGRKGAQPAIKVPNKPNVLHDEAGFVRIPPEKKPVQNTPKVPSPAENTTPPLSVKPKTGETQAGKGSPQTRRFIKTVRESNKTRPEVAKALEGKGLYKPKSNKVLLSQSRSLIKKDYDNAYQIATTEGSDRGVATATELIKLHQGRGEYAAAAEVADKAAANLTELGRGIQAASLYSKISPEGILRYAAREAQKAGKKIEPSTAEQLSQMAKDVAKMPDGEGKALAVQKMLDLVKSQNPSGTANKLITVWKAGLLSAPPTHAGNIMSNIIESSTKQLLVNPLAKAFDIPTSLITGKSSRGLTLRGSFKGGVEGTKRGVRYVRTGYDARNPLGKYELQNKVVFGKSRLGRIAQNYSDTVFKVLGAADQPFYYSNLRTSLIDRATTAAKNEGLKGDKRQTFIDDFLRNPPEEAAKGAVEDAKRSVFANKTMLGNLATGAKRDSAVGNFIIPFSQVPSSVASRILERSPAGYLEAANQLVKAARGKGFDQRLFTEHLANATVGTAGAFVIGKELSDHNMISLGMPIDQKEKARWKAEGKQPYSIKLGNKWISLNYVQPFGSVLAYGASYNEARKEGKSPVQATEIAAGEASKSVTSQSFLQGVSGTLQAVQDPSQFAGQFFQNTVGSIIPNMSKVIARATDSQQREINSPNEALKAGIPGLRRGLTPQQDVFGTTVPRSAPPVSTFLSPLRSSNIRGTAVTKEVDRLHNTDPNNTEMDVFPTPIQKSVSVEGKRVPLNDQQRHVLQNTIGQATEQAWSQLIKAPEYQQLSDPNKAKALRSLRIDIVAAAQRDYITQSGLGTYTKKATTSTQNILTGNLDISKYANKAGSSSKSASALTPNERYQNASDTYKSDQASYTDARRIRAQSSLNKLKVESGYSQNVVDLYGLNKNQLSQYLNSNPKGNDLAQQLNKLDQELYSSGVTSTLKYKNGFAPSAKASKGGSTKVAKAKAGPKYTLRKISTKRISAPKGIKVRKLAAFKAPRTRKLSVSKIPKIKVA